MKTDLYEHHTRETFPRQGIPMICHRDLIRQRENILFHMHWHENPEFIRFQGGTGHALVSAQRYDFLPGMLVSVNPNELHNFLAEGEDPHVIYDCMIVDAAFCQENGIDLSSLHIPTVLSDPEANELFDRAFEAFFEKDPLCILRARTAVLAFLLYMCGTQQSPTQRRGTVLGMDAVKNAVLFIRSNYMRPITLEDTAKAAGFSVYYFARRFKQLTGMTFVAFLNSVRCEHAAHLLRGGASVTEACFSCGFQEPAHFSRTFKQLLGVSPSSLRGEQKPSPPMSVKRTK